MKQDTNDTVEEHLDPESLLSNTTKSAPQATSEDEKGQDRADTRPSPTNDPSSSSLLGDKRRMLLLPVYLILVIGVSMSAAFVTIGMQSAQREQQSLFEKDADEFLQNLVTSLREYEVAGLWIHQTCRCAGVGVGVGVESNQTETAEEITFARRRQDFYDMEAYLKDTDLPYRRLVWAPNITHTQRPALEQETRDYLAKEHIDSNSYTGIVGASHNTTRPCGATYFKPRPAQPFYVPQHFIAPKPTDTTGDPLQDFDLLSSPVRAATVLKAMETYQPRLSERLSPDSTNVVLAHPGIPLPGEDPTTHKPQAVSLVVFNVLQLITRAMKRVQPKSKVVFIVDETPETPSDARYLAGAVFLVASDPNGGKACTGEDPIINVTSLSKQDMKYYHCNSKWWRLRNHHYHQDRLIELGGRNLIIYVDTIDETYEPQVTFVILGSALMLLACIFLAAWFATRLKRSRQIQQVTAAAKAEKAALLVSSAKQMAVAERELNDYVAHEVRNPLAAALTACSFVSSAVEEEVPLATDRERQLVREDMKVMSNSLHFVNDLLRNMLDLHRAANHQLNIEKIPTDVSRDILEPVASMLYQRAEQYKIHLICPERNIVISTDRIRLKQIMLNLANNSRKFVTKGFIRLIAEVVLLDEGTEQERSIVRLAVEDSGAGIPLQKRDKLFNKFQSSLDSLNQGTGIGLCLCKNLAQLMGGDIYLDESYDSGVEGFPGARFVVDLQAPPLSLSDDTETEAENSSESFGSRDIEKAVNNCVETPPNTKKPGFAEESRAIGALSSKPESTYGSPSKTSSVSGPVESATTSSTIGPVAATSGTPLSTHFPARQQLRKGTTTTTVSMPASHSMSEVAQADEEDLSLPETLNVLVVDDDLIVRKLFLRSIRRVAPTWTAKEASNGETALRMAATEDFDLIIMDQYMASIEKQLLGTETTRALRVQGCRARICGLSANDVEKAFLAAGADCFMLKPFPCEKVALAREMHRLLTTSREETPASTGSNSDTEKGTTVMPQNELA